MKKLLGICISLILIAVAIAPTFAIGATSTSGAENIIHFLNPTAIATVGSNLYVADNIEDNHSAIICFDVSNDTPVYRYTHVLDGHVVNLSDKATTGLYAVLTDSVVEFTVYSNGDINVAQTHERENAVDFAYGMYSSSYTEFALTKDQLYRKYGSTFLNALPASTLSNAKSCVAIDEYLYYLYEENGNVVCKRFDGHANAPLENDVFNSALSLNQRFFGAFAWGSQIALFSATNLSYVEVGSQGANTYNLMNYISGDNASIKDACASINGDKLFVLNDKNILEVYKGKANNFELVSTVGSDLVDRAVPTQYTSFTLACSNGYPTNIVYKTIADSSVPELITDADEYIILGFDGDEDCGYYYVLVGNNFGWVKKSDNAETVEKDEKIQVINTDVSNDSIDYKTKFNSLNAVYVYELPRENSNYTVFEQSATTMQEVTILQKFTELTPNGEKVWYYVLYGESERGFVNAESVGRFYLSVNSAEIKGIGARKINSTLFSAVKVYATEDLDDNELAYTPEGNEITLYSGQRVFLVREGEGWALIQIESNDGSTAFGYVKSNRLINVNDITTNAVVGLSLLGVAIVIAIIMLTVFVNRKHAKENKKGNDKK